MDLTRARREVVLLSVANGIYDLCDMLCATLLGS